MVKEFFKAILYKPLFNLLVFFSWLIPGHSVGWSIILLTLIVRAALWVPNSKSLKMPLVMREYQDDLKAIQEKHKDDRTAQSQATMAFYKEKGISPFSGCLPMLIQLPVLLILYRVFIAGLNNYRPDLLYSFTPHLSTINSHFFGIDLAKPDRWVLPILAAGLQFLQSWHFSKLNATPNKSNDPMAAMSKQMIYMFPVMTYFIAYRLPAGLALYWSISTAAAWLQQIYIRKTYQPTVKASVTVRSKKQ